LFSDDWAKVFEEVSNYHESFICSHVIQRDDNPDKRPDFIDSKEHEWVYWHCAKDVKYKNALGHIGAFVRFDLRALEVLTENVKQYAGLFHEFIIPTLLYGEGVSINTLSNIADNEDDSLKFTIYHSKQDPELRLGTGDVYWARKCKDGQMGPV
jgi:hypothetical protein